MKRTILFTFCALTVVSLFAQKGPENPGTPPANVLRPENSTQQKTSGEMKNAVTVQIGRDSGPRYQVTMQNNAAARTMLGYLSNSNLLFPTYIYEEKAGYVAQRVRGSYSRDDETTVADIKAGELYLVSGGQLRLYFNNVNGANLKATRVGYFENASAIGRDVQKAWNDNKGDYWGVEVYFYLKKN